LKKSNKIISTVILSVIAGIVLIYSMSDVHGPRTPVFESAEPATPGNYTRIISLAPNITETLFALGLGDRVVGVSRFCKYPAEALKIDKVGGFIDPNYEAIVLLKPDLVILLPEHENIRTYLHELGLRTAVVHNRVVGEILGTITAIGELCSAEQRAHELVSDIESRMNFIREKTRNVNHPRVMISVGRSFGSDSVTDVSIAGKNTFYDELITYAGGKNVYDKNDIPFPVISKEGILYLNPEFIIEMIPSTGEIELDGEMIRNEWKSIPDVDAVKQNHIYAFKQDYAVIPGPRFIMFLEDLAKKLHPELDWEQIH
jgi:iron complex transport system substrate-binding protein